MWNRSLTILAVLFLLGSASYAVAAPSFSYQRTLLPETNNGFDLGSALKVWANLYVNQICLSGDCKTAWPSGGGGGSGGLGTTSPWLTGQLAQVVNNSTVKSIATSSLGLLTTDVAEGSNLYWTNTRFDNRLSATTSLPNIVTLASLALPYSQLTGVPSTFGYPFPSNATSTKLSFTNGISISGATSQLQAELDVTNNTPVLFLGGASGCTNTTGLKTGTDGTFLFDAGCSIKFKGGSGLTWGYTDSSFNYVFQSDSLGNTTQSGVFTASGAGNNYIAGKLGIGTTSPVNPLWVETAGAVPATIYRNTSLSNVSLEIKNNSGSWFLGKGAGNNFNINTNNAIGTTPLLTLMSGGSFGIGTSSPYGQISLGGGNLVVGASAAGGTPGDLFLPKLGTAAGAFLAVDLSGKVIATTTPSGSGGGVTSIQQTGGGTTQTGAITFATSSAASNGLTSGLNITNSSGAFTFTPTLSGTLLVGGGGTGVGTFTSSQVLYGNGTNALTSVATGTISQGTGITVTGTGYDLGANITITNAGVTSNVAGTGISVSGATGAVTIGNTGVISNSCPGGFLTCSGTNPSSFSLGTLAIANGGTATTTGGVTNGVEYFDGTRITNNANFVNASGNIGIGSSSPTKLLVVEGSQTGGVAKIQRDVAASSNNVYGTYDVTLDETGGLQDLTGPAQTFGISNNNAPENILGDIAVVRNGADTTGAIVLRPYTTGTPASVLTIVGTGVGVGTSTPFGVFSITPPAGAWQFAIGSSTGTSFAINPFGGITLTELLIPTSTAKTIDWSATGPEVDYQTGTAATTITLINATTTQYAGSRKLVVVCNPSASAGAITWAGVEWAGGTVPTQTTTTNQCDTYSFFVTHATSTTAYKVFGAMSAGFQ